eukprot:527594_1
MGGCCSSGNQAEKTNVSPHEDTHNASAECANLGNNCESESMSADRQFIETLKEIPLLSSIPECDQKKLAAHLEERNYSAGENLMSQGDLGTEFFIIAKGRCKVIVSNDDGNEVEIAQLTDGDYCGEQALLKDAQRGATVRTICDTRCLILNQAAFKQITTDNNIRFAKRDLKRNAISAEMMEQFNNKGEEEKKENKNENGPNEEVIQWLLKSVDENKLFSH